MVPLLQAKLLRFLEEKSFKRVGGTQDIKVDVRVVAATNRSLQEEVKKGRFREDLFYRLNVMSVPLPPLRERKGDIAPLITHYIDTFNGEFRKKIRGVAPAAMAALQAYPWRGNVASYVTRSSARCCAPNGHDSMKAIFDAGGRRRELSTAMDFRLKGSISRHSSSPLWSRH